MRPLIRLFLCVSLLLTVIVLSLREKPRVKSPETKASPESVIGAAPSQRASVLESEIEKAVGEAANPPLTIPSADAAFTAFDHWAAAYLQTPAEERIKLLEQGVALAIARRSSLTKLIPANPREALEHAVPMVIRQSLPPEVLAQLEQRVSTVAFFGVKAALTDSDSSPVIRREVRTDSGQVFDAQVYGRRTSQKSTERAFISGIAVDRALAVDERPLRVLEGGEIPDTSKSIVETCIVSGKSAPVPRDASGAVAPITEETPAIEVGGTIHFLCSGGHILAAEDELIAQEGSTGGPTKPTGTIPGTISTGVRTLLWMRVAFPETNQDPQSEKDSYNEMRQVNDFFVENSFGNVYVQTTVTPLLILPRSEAWYKTADDDGAVLSDGRAAAKAAGYDPASYDLDAVIYRGGPGGFAGQAYVGAKGCWLKSSSVGVAAHEFGHNFGLWHANSWNTSGRSIIGDGTHVEYGNIFDTMGSASAGNNHFNAEHKNELRWLPTDFVHAVRASGTYRIFAMDQPRLEPSRRYGLKVRKDSDRDYWCEFRQKFSSNAWMMSGVSLNWSPWAQSAGGAHLLDTTPGSPDDKTDAPLTIGRTFSDLQAGVHITPIGKGGTVPESMDVIINIGAFPSNQAPTLSLTASATTAATNASVTFTAGAQDPDGDPLSFAWDFGDKSFSPVNAAVVSKSWSSAGEYAVRCTVSDMKGKTTTNSVLVRVGSPSTFRISGTVTFGGQPLADVRIHNGLTGSSYRGSFTNSDGTYTITGLAAGTYTVGASLYGYGFGTQSVAVGPNATGINFTATETPQVSISIADSDCRESGVNTGTFRISRSGSTASALAVNLLNPTGTATKGGDYTLAPDLANQTLTIPAGAAFLDVVVTPVDDSTAEGSETVTFELLPGTGYILAGIATQTLSIVDSDSTLPVVSLRPVDTSASESGDPGSVIFTRTGSTAAALTVPFTIATGTGQATNGTDYTNIGSSIAIPAGASSATLTIAPLQDTVLEGTETVTINISSNAAYIRNNAETSTTVYIEDDDQPIVTIQASDATATEAGSDPGTFVVARTGLTAAPLTVYYTLGGSAHQGVDYLPIPGVLTIPAGSSTGSVTIVPIDDTIGEEQQTVIAQLRAGSGYIVGTAANATINIADNDLPVVTLTVNNGTAVEPSDTGVFRFTTAGTGSGNIDVHYTVTGTATSGTDYQALSGTVSMGKNTTADVIITPIDDSLPEGTETITVSITPDPAYSIHLDTSATILLQDDEASVVQVSTADTSLTESGSTGQFYIWRSGATTSALTVNYAMSGTATNGTDYQNLSGTVVIPSGTAGSYITVTPTQDSLAEGTETITLTLASGSYSIGLDTATLYLPDDDAVATQVRFASSTGSGAESNGTINIPVTLNAASASTVTVEYRINGGSALNGVDYNFISGKLTYAPGETSKNLQLILLDDPFIESNETVVLQLLNPNGAALGTSSFTYTINDNDTAPGATVGFASSIASGTESIAAPSIPVTLSAVQAAAVSVSYSVTGGTAAAGTDYNLATGTLTFAAGETAKLIPCSIVNDTTVESSETIIITLTNPSGATLGSNSVHTYTISDDDASIVTVASNDNQATESGDLGTLTFSRTGSTTSALSINVSVSGTATNGADYQSIASSVSIPAGQASTTVNVTPYLDGFVEGDETIIVSLQAGGGYTIGSANSASVTISENAVLVSIAASDSTASESGSDTASFTISRSGPTTDPLVVNLALTGTATSGQDYTAPSLPITIPAGQSQRLLVITPIDDASAESAETVIATLQSGADYVVGASNTATVTISDNDVNLAPTVTIDSPTKNNIAIPASVGLVLETTVTDDGKPANPGTVSIAWTKQGGPGTVTFGNVAAADTTAQFSAPGSYTLRITASDGQLSTFSDIAVAVGGVPPFTGQNINASTPAGSHSLSSGTYTVQGGGANISGTSDSFYFLSQPMTGDGEIRARIVSMTGGNSSAKAGVMFRNDTTGGSRMAYCSMYGPASTTNSHSFRVRTSESADIANTGVTGAPSYPKWVRVVRAGDSFSGYVSTDGQQWTQVGATQTVSANAQMLVGLGVTSNNTASLCTAIFDNVSISSWPSNIGPAVNAGPDQSIALPGSANLAAIVSDDGKPQPPGTSTLNWSKLSGPGTATFGDVSAGNTTVTLSQSGAYALRLTANDGEVKTFDDLQITSSQVIVSISATGPSAAEFGLAESSFTLSRTGSTTSPLTVQLSWSGSATNGVDYEVLPDEITFATGQSTKVIDVTPLADGVAEGTESIALDLVPDAAYGIGIPDSASISLLDLPMDMWRFQKFGANANNQSIAGDHADFDLDGMDTLIEYAFGREPITDDTYQPIIGLEAGVVTITYQRSITASDVTFGVDESADLGSWSPAAATTQILSTSGNVQVIKSSVPLNGAAQKFLRLSITR